MERDAKDKRSRACRVIAGVAMAIVPCLAASCDDCPGDGKGTVTIKNGMSDALVVVVDGATLGKVYPGDSDGFDVASGEHRVEYKFEGGGDACSGTTLFVGECENEEWCCPADSCASSQSGGCPSGFPLDCGDYCCGAGAYCCAGGCCSL
jgi:hypothetical protein